MFNIHLSYKLTSSSRVLLRYGGYPGQFSCLKKFRALVVPSGGCCKGINIQVIITPTRVLTNGQS